MTRSRIERQLNEVHTTSHTRLAALAIAAAATAAFLTVAGMTSGAVTAADRDALPPSRDMALPLSRDVSLPLSRDVSLPPRTNEGTGYFPAQYVNQATEASEHIQAY
jgi:hypothetical protein